MSSAMGIMGGACSAVGPRRTGSIPISNTDNSWEATKWRKHLSGKSKSNNLESKGEGGSPSRERREYESYLELVV